VDRLRARVRERRAAGRDAEAQRLAVEQLAVQARRAMDWSKDHASPLLARFEADWAEAITEGGDAGAARTFERLIRDNAQVPGGRARLEVGLGRALLAAGNDAEAFVVLRLAADRSDLPPPPEAPTGTPRRSEAFWNAWTLILEIQLKQNAGDERSGAVRAHLRRLEAIDPALGGEPWSRRLGVVRRAVDGR
jgi:hypothetical protein